MERFTVEVYCLNSPGVLHRIAGVYAKSKVNILSLHLEETSNSELSRLFITACGSLEFRLHLVRLLARLYDVKSVSLNNSFR